MVMKMDNLSKELMQVFLQLGVSVARVETIIDAFLDKNYNDSRGWRAHSNAVAVKKLRRLVYKCIQQMIDAGKLHAVPGTQDVVSLHRVSVLPKAVKGQQK